MKKIDEMTTKEIQAYTNMLCNALNTYLDETKKHVESLKDVFKKETKLNVCDYEKIVSERATIKRYSEYIDETITYIRTYTHELTRRS